MKIKNKKWEKRTVRFRACKDINIKKKQSRKKNYLKNEEWGEKNMKRYYD